MDTLVLDYRLMSRAQLRKKLDRGDRLQLWNVLSRERYRADANIPGSRHVPVESLEQRCASAARGEPVVLYSAGPCCRQAKEAALKLKELGFTDVSVYEGGLEDWADARFPLARLSRRQAPVPSAA